MVTPSLHTMGLAPALTDEDALRLGTECHSHGLVEHAGAAQEFFARCRLEKKVLGGASRRCPNIVRRQSEGTEISTPWDMMRALDPARAFRELMRWDPFRELNMRRLADLGFDPRFDLKETKAGYVIRADVPGVNEKDVDVAVTGNRLQVSGSRKVEEEEKTDTYYTCERAYGSFTRVFTLPDDADADAVNADLRDGVLSITIGRRADAQAKHIAVKANGQQKKS
jgi:HSP20 family protein